MYRLIEVLYPPLWRSKMLSKFGVISKKSGIFAELFPDTRYNQKCVCVITRKHYFLTEFRENLEKRKVISRRELSPKVVQSYFLGELFPEK